MNHNINQKTHNLFIGTILGDASIYKHKTKSYTSIRFEQSIEHIDYLFHLYNTLKNYTLLPPKQRVFTDTRYDNKNKVNISYVFSTMPLEQLNVYSTLFLDCFGKKTIPINIADHINVESLAYWIMDDGQKVSRGGITLCTDSYSLKEIEILRNALKTKLNLTTTIHSKKGRKNNVYYNWIYISKNQAFKDISFILRQHMLPSFYYKLPVYKW